jgi:hypothetical protein
VHDERHAACPLLHAFLLLPSAGQLQKRPVRKSWRSPLHSPQPSCSSGTPPPLAGQQRQLSCAARPRPRATKPPKQQQQPGMRRRGWRRRSAGKQR